MPGGAGRAGLKDCAHGRSLTILNPGGEALLGGDHSCKACEGAQFGVESRCLLSDGAFSKIKVRRRPFQLKVVSTTVLGCQIGADSLETRLSQGSKSGGLCSSSSKETAGFDVLRLHALS